MADRLVVAVADFVAAARACPGDPAVAWHAGLPMPVSTFCALATGEALVHGHDIARALRRRWPIDPESVALTLSGLLPVLPHFVDPPATAGLSARFDIRLRGQPTGHAVLAVADQRLSIDAEAAGPIDCRISAAPAPFLLVLYSRTGPWRHRR